MTKQEPRRLDVDRQELEAILERTRSSISPDDHEKMKAAVDTLGILTRELETKGTSLDRLRRLLFGPRTETTSRVLGDVAGDQGGATGDGATVKEKRPGHGRHGVAAYHGADR